MNGLPFSGTNLQKSVVSFDNYLLVVGEDADKEKHMFYFDVEAEKWYDINGEIPCSVYNPSECNSGAQASPVAIDFMCKKKYFSKLISYN